MDLQTFLSDLRRADPFSGAVALAAGCALTICGFLFFQYVVGLAPCPLCYEQRYAFYIGLGLTGLLALGAKHGASGKVIAAGLIVLAAIMLWNAGLGVYHAGIEWKFWQGPAECSGGLAPLGGPGGLLRQLQTATVVRCDEAAWRLFGISLPGWNVLVSLAHAALAGWIGFAAIGRAKAKRR